MSAAALVASATGAAVVGGGGAVVVGGGDAVVVGGGVVEVDVVGARQDWTPTLPGLAVVVAPCCPSRVSWCRGSAARSVSSSSFPSP